MEAVEQRPALEMTPCTSELVGSDDDFYASAQSADSETVEDHEPHLMPTDPEIVEEDEPYPLTGSDIVEEEIEPYVTPHVAPAAESEPPRSMSHVTDPDIREDMHHPMSQSSDYDHSYFTPLEHFPEPSIEELFADVQVGSWREQLTLRAFVVSFVLTLLFTFVAIKVNLTTGLVPTLTVPVALLGFCMVQNWTFLLSKFGFQSRPFSRQENTIIQTCFSTAYEIAFSGGLGTYLLAMTRPVAEQAGEGESAEVIELSPRWIVPFLFCVSYAGSFIVVILRKTMIINLRLPYSSGMAAGDLINSFHTPHAFRRRQRQSTILIGSTGISLAWTCFKWFFSGGKGCGFNNFPTFGLKAFKQRLYFDSSATYVGMGMISPNKVTYSLTIGAVLSWAVLWPLIGTRKGHWYDGNLSDTSFHGLQGYKVAISLAIIFGDAIYKFVKVLYHIFKGLCGKCKPFTELLPSRAHPSANNSPLSYDDERRALYFAQDPISTWMAIFVYIALAAISFLLLPPIYPFLRWYHILIPYIIAVPLAFFNAYGSGVTDWSLAASYSRFVIYIMASWAGVNEGGIITGLAACGVITNIVSAAAGISQDMKTGYMTLTAPRAMLIAQIIGVTIGCILSPTVFFLFLRASPDIGGIGSDYPAPNALVYRLMAIVGVEGVSGFPKHCLLFSLIAFLGALALDIITDIGERYQQKWVMFMPLPMAMAIPLYVGGSFAIDMCVGSCILYVWCRINNANSNRYARIFASGLILGDGLWTLISSLLSIFGIESPMCLRVLPRGG